MTKKINNEQELQDKIDNKIIFSISSIIFGILSIICCFYFEFLICLILGVILGIIGIILSIIVRRQKSTSTTDGLILSVIGTTFNIIIGTYLILSFVTSIL